MKHLLRRASVGAVAFLAASAIAAPAFAETTADLSVAFKGTTIAAGSEGKIALFTVTNKGPQAATDITFDLDLTQLDTTKVQWSTEGIGCDDPNPADKIHQNCVFGSLDAGATADWYFSLTRKAGQTGAAGTVKVTVKADEDQTTDNNTASAKVTLDESKGVDLTAFAWDISKVDGNTFPPTDEPLLPGEASKFWVVVANFGSVDSFQLNMEIKLPTGVTFVGDEPDCDYNTGSTSTKCTYKGTAGLIKAGKAARFYFDVKLAADAVGPATVGGGLFTVTDVQAASSALSATELPKNMTAMEIKDIDKTDNVDEFNVWVGKAGGQGGGLPITGANIAVIGGAGVAVLLAGGVLFLVTRRRRVTV